MNCWDPSGVQVELAVSWLARRHPEQDIRVWGISATLAEPELALEALVGFTEGALIRADIHKDIEVESTMPQAFAKSLWAGHIGLQLLDEVAEVVEAHQSTLIFTNTRRQAEVWYQALLDHKPEWAGFMAMHHGSIARELREWVEDALHDGRLRAVVCTASPGFGRGLPPGGCGCASGRSQGGVADDSTGGWLWPPARRGEQGFFRAHPRVGVDRSRGLARGHCPWRN